MDRSTARESARIGVIGATYLAGFAVAGPVGAAAMGIAGEIAASIAQQGLDNSLDRYFGDNGIREPDLLAILRRAYLRSIDQLEQDWRRIGAHHYDGSEGLFQTLRDDGNTVLTSGVLAAAAADSQAMRTLGRGHSTVRAAFLTYLNRHLRLHGEGLADFVRGRLERQIAAFFAEELCEDRSQNNRAWRAYQRLVSDAIQSEVAQLRIAQTTSIESLAQLDEAMKRIESWMARLSSQSADARDRTVEASLEVTVDQLRGELLATLTEGFRLTQDIVVEQAGRTQKVVAELRDEIRQQDGRNSIADAEILLRGPIRALQLQATLEHADALVDRQDAANLYGEIATRLADQGYEYHAKQMRERRAEALVAAGRIDDAFAIWLDDAAEAIEAGELWVPIQAHTGFEKHSVDVMPSLKARAIAVEAYVNWYEQPETACSDLESAFKALREAGDRWTPRVGCWLGEALAVDGAVGELRFEEFVPGLQHELDAADESTTTRIHILAAEVAGDWNSIAELASVGEFSPGDAGLVFSRHGRWLALHGDYKNAINEYRRAIEKLTQAKLLGDTAGALRSITQIRLRYTEPWSEQAREEFELARSIDNESTRIVKRYSARNVALEAIHGEKPYDGHRSLRRYMLEARISGHLQFEIDAHELLGDLYTQAGFYDRALPHLVLAGRAKKAREVARNTPPVSVESHLFDSPPWVVGSALAVIAAQGDLLSPKHVSTIAPRLIELTSGMEQSFSAPEVKVEAWNALKAIALQLPDESIDALLERLEPLIDREPNHYTRMDRSILGILKTLYRFRPDMRDIMAPFIVSCLKDPELTRQLRSFLAWAAKSDAQVLEALVQMADNADRLAVEILVDADIHHKRIQEEARRAAASVLAYEVGIERTEMSVSNRFQVAGKLAFALEDQEASSLADHLLEIAQDALSPEVYRSAAAEAVGILANELEADHRAMAWNTMMTLVSDEPSKHPIDQLLRGSTNPLNRFRMDLSALNLRDAAIWAAARVTQTMDEGNRVFRAMSLALQIGSEREMDNAIHTILSMDASVRPPLDVVGFSRSPHPRIRMLAAALWCADPHQDLSIGFRLSTDPNVEVRRYMAAGMWQVRGFAPEFASYLQENVQSKDVSAYVRLRSAVS